MMLVSLKTISPNLHDVRILIDIFGGKTVALGGTLSSYTWLCMIINFLQCRHPKILPSLQKPPYFIGSVGDTDGFDEAHELTKDFSQNNRETLGDLLFAFFRRYAHEVDYERFIISVREGCLISKQDKRWHPSQNTRLCVEEPFNIDRNLGNTADDTSFRGVHLELRRAFDLISLGKLEECFEEYHFPPLEERNLQNQHLFSKPVPQPRPVLTRSQSQTGSSRSPRAVVEQKKVGHQTQKQRVGTPNRRASSAVPPHKMPTYPMAFVDMQTSGSQIHETLAHQYQRLQRQEQQLRAKMQHQGTLQSQMFGLYPNANHLYLDTLAHMNGDMHRRHSNAGRSPHQVPLQHFTPLANVPGIANFLPPGFLSNQATSLQAVTNPPSPSLTHAQLGFRNSTRRSATTDSSQYMGARSHSQPPTKNQAFPQQIVYVHPEAYMNSEWQGIMLGQRSLQEIQNDYLQVHQRRHTNDEGYGVNVTDHQRFDSPVAGSDYDSASIQDEGISKDGSIADSSYYRGGRSQTLPHIVDAAYQYEQRQAERELAKSTGLRSRPRASSSIATHGISFFANEAMDSPEQRYAQPVRNLEWQNTRASFSRRIRPDFDPTFKTNTAEASNYGLPPEHVVELARGNSTYSSDAIITPESSATTPTQEISESLAFDGNSEKGSTSTPLPTAIQFGQFPARAPYRTGQQPKPDDLRGSASGSGSSRGLYSHTLSGLGINISNSNGSKDHGMVHGGVKQSSTVAGLNLASTLKPGSVLSPVREVRTPSPTAIRNGLFMHHQIKAGNSTGRLTVNGSKEIVSSPLAAGSTTYAKAHDRARSVESAQRELNKQDRCEPPALTKVAAASASQFDVKSTQNTKLTDSSGRSLPKQNGSASSLVQAPSQPPPQPPLPAQPQQGGWQQSGAGKKKKNKKAASVGSIILPLDVSERKGG